MPKHLLQLLSEKICVHAFIDRATYLSGLNTGDESLSGEKRPTECLEEKYRLKHLKHRLEH